MPALDILSNLFLTELPTDRRWSYLCFASALLIALGSYQFVSPVKVAIFMDVVGTDKEPVAKSLVLLVLFPVLFFYSFAVSLLRDPRKLVLCVCGFYGIVYLIIVLGLISGSGRPAPWIAWLLYYATETRSVIVMPMIWSVLADVTTPDLAKKAYAPIFCAVQVGGILGSCIAVKVSSLGGEVGLLLIQTVSFIFIAGLTWIGCSILGQQDEETPLAPREKEPQVNTAAEGASDRESLLVARSMGLKALYEGFEGLYLLLSRPYVFMAFWVSYANLMPRTIIDYQNSVLITSAYASREDQIAVFGRVNLMVNASTCLLTLIGTRPIVEWLGVGKCLLVLPLTMLLCILALCAHYSLWTSVWCLVISGTWAYGLNSPCKEMLYVRTSREIKYKAKSWSEMYGNQLIKLLGAQVNLWVNLESEACAPHCFNQQATAVISVGWVVLWAAIAGRLGWDYTQLELEDKRVN